MEARAVTVTYPQWCEQTVYRMVQGTRCAFTERVYWIEAYGRWKNTDVPNDMWAKRPHGQLHKCAKAAVLRSAFPEAADYAAEEMEGREIASGGSEPKDVTPSPETLPAPTEAPVDAGSQSHGEQASQAEQKGDMDRIVKIVGLDGEAVYVGSVTREALLAYGRAKRGCTDPQRVAVENLAALEQIRPFVRNGNLAKLEAEIEATRAIAEGMARAAAEEAAESLLQAEVDEDGVVLEGEAPDADEPEAPPEKH
jgi:hypothetical protein